MKTSVIILNWNGLKFLKMFLDSVVKYSTAPGTEVCIADNGSTDGSVEWVRENFKEVRIISLGRNYGFAGGYNRAIGELRSDYFVIINSDIEVTGGWLQPLVEFMDNNTDAAACQPKILSYYNRDHFEYAGAAGGYIDKFGYPFCRGRILHITEKDSGQYDYPADIFWSSGACMIVRSLAWKACGGFDEDFFAHMEEIDLCWRFHKTGYRVGFIPWSVVYHIGGGSLNYDSPFKVYLNFRNSLYMLYKNLPGGKLWPVLLSRMILDGVSALVFLARGRFRNFFAVVRAHISFYKNFAILRQKRKVIGGMPAGENTGMPLLNKSIIFEFYCRCRKTFTSVMHKT